MSGRAHPKHVRVAGNVVPRSIKRSGKRVEFLNEGNLTLPVSGGGGKTPPDTFKHESQALADGILGDDGIFQTRHRRAKFASKYASLGTLWRANSAMKAERWYKATLEQMRQATSALARSGFSQPRTFKETRGFRCRK